jgi:hypothetical protein
MEKLDFKKRDRAFYGGKSGRFDLLTVPEMVFLMVDGQGDPNTTTTYAHAVQALYSVSYAAKFMAKATLGKDHAVGPLEGLWWAEDLSDFAAGRRQHWRWTMMIRQPDWVDAGLILAAKRKAPAKGAAEGAFGAVRLQSLSEGVCLQTLHLGPYSDEAAVIARMHEVEMPKLSVCPTGKHHEIYLSDPRRVAQARLKTVLRQPVTPL